MTWSKIWITWITSDERQTSFYYFLHNFQLLNTSMKSVNPLISKTFSTSHEWFMKPMLLFIILLLLKQFFRDVVFDNEPTILCNTLYDKAESRDFHRFQGCNLMLDAAVLLLLVEAVKELSEKAIGARKSKRNMNSKLPRSLFDMAKLAYKSETCETLIRFLKDQKDLDVNERMPAEASDNQMTLFLCACFSGSERLLRFMLCYGADIHSRTKWADSPLHLVTFAISSNKNRDFGAIDVLLEVGCDINCKNWIGNTPLCIAASHGNTRIIKYLLRKGADPSIGNSKGIYPIDFANNADNGEAADLLKFDVPNPYVWDVIEPHTPPRIKLGLQSPCKQHLVDSTFTRRQRKREKHVLN